MEDLSRSNSSRDNDDAELEDVLVDRKCFQRHLVYAPTYGYMIAGMGGPCPPVKGYG